MKVARVNITNDTITAIAGDTIFALATGTKQASVNTVGMLAAEVIAQAVL